jgi:hypothetical protein
VRPIPSFINNSGQPIPYKPEGVDHQPPSIAQAGDTVDADGIYSPLGTENPIAVKIPDNSQAELGPDGRLTVRPRAYPYGLGYWLWGADRLLPPDLGFNPKQLTPDDLQQDEYQNWPDPYEPRYWPYPAWLRNPDKPVCP